MLWRRKGRAWATLQTTTIPSRTKAHNWHCLKNLQSKQTLLLPPAEGFQHRAGKRLGGIRQTGLEADCKAASRAASEEWWWHRRPLGGNTASVKGRILHGESSKQALIFVHPWNGQPVGLDVHCSPIQVNCSIHEKQDEFLPHGCCWPDHCWANTASLFSMGTGCLRSLWGSKSLSQCGVQKPLLRQPVSQGLCPQP